ncbi:hypothetical protein LY76DRAFT_604868 [Colletotrichum caudatum]|nr:hypothetical protein LY76DRAFT_604868 [Colletotrichum caudatum]
MDVPRLTMARPLALIEAAFYFANKDLITENDRENFSTRCVKQIAAFSPPTPTSFSGAKEDDHTEYSQSIAQTVAQPIAQLVNQPAAQLVSQPTTQLNPGPQGRKRKREHVDAPFVAMSAGLWGVRYFLGTYLSMGFKNSHIRQYEIAKGNINITYALELHFPHQGEDDFKLFIPLSSSIERTFEEALSGPFENLADMVNEWLYEALARSQSYAKGGMSDKALFTFAYCHTRELFQRVAKAL